MQTWEYKVVSSEDHGTGFFRAPSREQAEAALNELGRAGWELVAMDFLEERHPELVFTAVLKRPVP